MTDPTTDDDLVVTQKELHDSVALAMQTGRTDALLDAEKAILDYRDSLKSFQLSESRTLNNAAARIRALPGVLS